MSHVFRALITTFCVLALGAPAVALARLSPSQPDKASQALANLPLAFEQNQGQVNPSVKFLARGPGYQVFLTPQEAVMVLGGAKAEKDQLATVVRMRFDGANPAPVVKGEETLGHTTNYLFSANPKRNLTNITSHARVKYEGVYPGIDVVYYGNQGHLEYDVLVAPGAKIDPIKIKFPGAKKISISAEGDLVLAMPTGDVRYHKPVAYQEFDGQRKSVAAEYKIAKNGKVGFQIGAYDTDKTLVIDPILSYSSYLWGNALGVALDPAGNSYLVGAMATTSLPASGTYQTRLKGYQDAYVAKLDPTGTRLIYATYLGAGRTTTVGNAIAVDSNGNAYIGGTTTSSGFPVTMGAYQTVFGSGFTSFITKINPSGTALTYSTFVNGVNIVAIALDSSGHVYSTGSGNGLITTSGAFQVNNPSVNTLSPFVSKLNASGGEMMYASYLGGSAGDTGKSIAVDGVGNAYITGTTVSTNFPTANPLQPSLRGSRDAFVSKINSTGSALIYSTYLGGGDTEYGYGIVVDTLGQAIVVGRSFSTDFPTTVGSFQPRKAYPGVNFSNGFIARLNSLGSGLVYASYIGGKWCLTPGVTSCDESGLFKPDGDSATAVAVDAAGYAYVGGHFTSAEFPEVDPIQSLEGGADMRVLYVAKVRPDGGALAYSLNLGHRNGDIVVNALTTDVMGSVHAVALSISRFPITPGAQLAVGTSQVIFKLSPGKYPTVLRPTPSPVTNAQPITLTADVQSTVLGGTVTFSTGAGALGSASVVAGAATLSVSLPPGVHKITAVYSGDGKVSPPLFQLVNAQ